MEKSRVYALIENDIVTRLEGEYTLPTDLDGWTLIEEGTPCDRLNLAQAHYLPKPLTDERGVYRYKAIVVEDLDETEVKLGEHIEILERDENEMDMDFASRPKPQKSTLEMLVDALEANKPNAHKDGFDLVLASHDGMIVWEYVPIEPTEDEIPSGTYIDPIQIPNNGITTEVGKWYYTTDKDLPHEAIVEAFVMVEDFDDRRWFDFV